MVRKEYEITTGVSCKWVIKHTIITQVAAGPFINHGDAQNAINALKVKATSINQPSED